MIAGTEAKILVELAECDRGRGAGAALRSALAIPIHAWVHAIGNLEVAGYVVEDRHNRGVIVLTACGAAALGVEVAA